MEEARFLSWLENEIGLTNKSARDVVSRLKRANTLVDVSYYPTPDHAIFELSQHPEFQKISASVKSQMRRSIRLFFDFAKNNQKKNNSLENPLSSDNP